MNTRYTTVNLDVSQQGSIPSITLSQYDLGVGLSFYIMDGGLPYSEFAETDTVVLSGTKPSGVGFTVPAYYKSGNLCSFRTPQAMTTEAGTVTCEITITKVNNISVSTANFFVEVEASAHAHETVDEDIEDFSLIANQVGEYKAVAVRAAQQAAQSATDAAASAGGAEESMEAAQSAASSAIAAKDDIQEYIDDSEAWARGTRGGTAVPSTDETYENNAKYYAEQSSQASMDAGVSATEAAASAQAAAASVVGAVKYTAQTLTTEQKAQARTNIGAASPSDIPSGTVRYDTAQSLTDAQKTQAKNNIGVPAIDATLAVTGAAADAKKVGDEIADIKGDLSELELDTTLSKPSKPADAKTVGDTLPNNEVLVFENKAYSTEIGVFRSNRRLLSSGYIVINVGDYFSVGAGYKVLAIIFDKESKELVTSSGFISSITFDDTYVGMLCKICIKNDDNTDISASDIDGIADYSFQFLGYVKDGNVEFVNKTYSVTEMSIKDSETRIITFSPVLLSSGDSIAGNNNNLSYRLIAVDSDYIYQTATDWIDGTVTTEVHDNGVYINGVGPQEYEGIVYPSNSQSFIVVRKKDNSNITPEEINGVFNFNISSIVSDVKMAKCASMYNVSIAEETLKNAVDALDNNLDKVIPNAENMIWTWWFFPEAIRFTRVRDKTFWGFTDQNGYSGIAEYDHGNGNLRKILLRKGEQIDDHNTCAILITPSGNIVVAYAGGHNVNKYMFVRASTNPESIEKFDKEIALSSLGTTTYCQMFLYDNVIYMFYRAYISYESGASNWGTRWAYRYSNDGGYTWSNETVIIDASGFALYYCKFAETNTPGMIRMCMLSHNSENDMNIRMGFFNCNNRKIYNSNGTTILGESNISKSSFTIVLPIQSGIRYRLFDVAVTDVSKPLLLYASFTGNNVTDSVYKIFDSGNTVSIVNGGEAFYHPSNYLGGCTWIGNSEIVLSRNDNGTDKIELYSYENGSVSLMKEIFSEAKGTLPIRNSRPIVDKTNRMILWHRGRYNPQSFLDFETDPKMYDISEDTIIL